MKRYKLPKDIKLFCIDAISFPDGILAAHQKLQSLLETIENRKFYGISYGTNEGKVIYKAGVAELFKGEGEKLGCESFIISKGEYIGETIINWKSDEQIVEKTFKKLLSDHRRDENGYCLEIYLNENDMRCLVKLNPEKIWRVIIHN